MTTQKRAQFWHQQITTWQASGLSGQAFCKKHDLSYHQFVYWRRKQDKTRSDQQEAAAGFARVTQSQTVGSSGELTLSLPNGLSITGFHAGNVELLGSILRQL